MRNTQKSVGEQIQAIRSRLGLTQFELAEKAGISLRGVQDIERGLIASPRISTLYKIADAFGMQIESLTGDAPASPNESQSKSELVGRIVSALSPLDQSQLSGLLRFIESMSGGSVADRPHLKDKSK